MRLAAALAAMLLGGGFSSAATTEVLPGWAAPSPKEPPALALVHIPSPSPLLRVKLMVKAGSAQDPAGAEGLAGLAGRLLIEGGFGDPRTPMTKDKLAELTRAWGGEAYPRVEVTKEATLFSATIPKDALAEYVREVLEPMLGRPLFLAGELDRVRAETLQGISSTLRLETIEQFGLAAMDNLIHERTAYAHPDQGTEKGLASVDPAALRRFYASYYLPDNAVLGVSGGDEASARELAGKLAAALASGTHSAGEPGPRRTPVAGTRPEGRRLLILSQPNAISAGIHAGFLLPLTRKDGDFWPLYAANLWFGAHRDGFSHLFKVLREERGYNYGDYSYVEHFEGRPENLFAPPNAPRRVQYFSVWLRPVSHEYVPHLLKALTWELDHFVRSGLTEEQCEAAKNKARVLYLSLADTADRILGSRLDDAFYGMDPGYLDSYLSRIGSLTCARMNEAVRKYLQARDLQYLVVTREDAAAKIAEAVAAGGPAWGKSPSDYQLESKEDSGRKIYSIPEEKLDLLRLDAVWANTPLDLPKDRIRTVPAGKMFETSEIPGS